MSANENIMMVFFVRIVAIAHCGNYVLRSSMCIIFLLFFFSSSSGFFFFIMYEDGAKCAIVSGFCLPIFYDTYLLLSIRKTYEKIGKQFVFGY